MKTDEKTEKIRLSSQVRHRAVDDEGVLVHLENGRVLVVNEVGLFIVQMLASAMSRRELAEAVAAEFEVAPDQAKADLDQYLAELDREQVLERIP